MHPDQCFTHMQIRGQPNALPHSENPCLTSTIFNFFIYVPYGLDNSGVAAHFHEDKYFPQLIRWLLKLFIFKVTVFKFGELLMLWKLAAIAKF